MSDLEITAVQRQGGPVFKLSGSLNLTARARLRDTVERAWDGYPLLGLDLSEVDELDLSGLGWLLTADAHMRGRGGRLEIVATSAAVRQAMALVGPATRGLALT